MNFKVQLPTPLSTIYNNFYCIMELDFCNLSFPSSLYVLFDNVHTSKCYFIMTTMLKLSCDSNFLVFDLLLHFWAKNSMSHCLDMDLNGLLTRRNFWSIEIENSEKLPKWHFFTHAWKSKFFWAKCQILSKNVNNKKCAPELVFFNEKKRERSGWFLT